MTPTERARRGGVRRRQEGGQGREPRAAPQRASREAAARPPPPTPPTGLQAAGAPAPTFLRQGGWSPLPPPERGAGAPPSTQPQPPAPTGTAGNKGARANAPGRRTDRAQRRRKSTNRSGMGATPPMTRTTPVTPALVPAEARQRDGTRQSDPPPCWPPRPHKRGTRRTGCPPPPPTRSPAHERHGPAPRGAHSPKPGRGELGPDRPFQARQTEQGTRAGHAEQHGPRGTALPAPSAGTARGARATPPRGGGRGSRGSASAHTRKGHAGTTRRATGPSLQNAQTAWNGVPGSEGKGHPDRTAGHTQRGTPGAGRGKRERHNTRFRPEPPEPAASAAHTQTGHCTRQGSSGALHHTPTPRLGSLRASPRGSHWRQASSTGPAAPAPQATTHQGGDAVGKRLQPRLQIDALTGEWRNGEAGEGQGSEPCEPGGHQAGGASW